MCTPTSNTQTTLLSLPDDILSKIFNHLGPIKYTLQSSIDALNLSLTNTRLQQIFARQLTHITPITENSEAPAFSESHFASLVRTAGSYLTELQIPDGQHAYVAELPNICPNLQVLSYFEMHHRLSMGISPGSDTSLSSDSEQGDVDMSDNDDLANPAGDAEPVHSDHEEDNDNEDDAENLDDGNGVNPAGNADPDDSDHEHGNDVEEDEGNPDDGNVVDANAEPADGDDNDAVIVYDSDCDEYLSEVTISHHVKVSCGTTLILPRLKLRKLSLTRPPKAFFENMTNHNLEELHLYKVQKNQLALIIPLLSQPLKAVTVTLHEIAYISLNGQRVSEFIDALIPLISHIASLTLHIPFHPGLSTVAEHLSEEMHYFSFPDEAALRIATARQNTCHSQCTMIDLKGEATFRVLSAVDRKASITLARGRVTVRDDGDGMHIIGLPLHDDFLARDVTHLEKAYILKKCRRLNHVCNPEWGRRLAGHKLKVIRTSNARVLNTLKFSAEKLELFWRGIRQVTDWTFLSGVRELYLLGIPWRYSCTKERHRTIEVIQALPSMIDAFQGELIWVGIYSYVECENCPFLDDLTKIALETTGAIDRYERRGGDAGTLRSYVKSILKQCEKGAQKKDMASTEGADDACA